MTRNYWLSVAAYVIPTFPLGYAWHLSVFRSQYEALGLYREDVIVPLGLASMVIQGLLFAGLFPRLFSTAPADWLASAARFALTFGALSWSFQVLPVAAKYNMTSITDFVALETGFTAVHFALAAPLIALANRKRSQSSSSDLASN